MFIKEDEKIAQLAKCNETVVFYDFTSITFLWNL